MDEYQDKDIDPAFRCVVSHWMTKIEHAKKHKDKVFGVAAKECQDFYDGARSWDQLMGAGAGFAGDDEDRAAPSFKVSVNKTFEFVTIFGPAMYEENPVRTVKPRMPVVVPAEFFPDPVMAQAYLMMEDTRVKKDGLTSVLLESYLNWTPVEFHLAEEARSAIDEALIKGRGCLWTELYKPPASETKVVRSMFDSTDNLLVDPDAASFDKAHWIARRCVEPIWKVERDFGLKPGSLKGNSESQSIQAEVEASDDLKYDRARGLTSDLIVYWKVYSKMGIGGRLTGLDSKYRRSLEMFGDYAYLAVAKHVPYPLNLCPDVYNDPSFAADPEAILGRVAWPTPFWGADAFPVSVLDFHSLVGCPWPLPHLKAGMGELKFLNWVMSFLMGKIRNTSRDFIAIKKEANEEMKNTILEGRDLSLIEIEGNDHGTISEIVSFLQHPEVNGDIWKMIEAVENNFDKRVGLTELMYGQQGATQIRSAQEASLRNQNMNVRPDDMRKCVESWMARVSTKEAICARYHLADKDVEPALGSMGGLAWGNYVATRDVNKACRQLEYRIEAGSTSRPNKEWEAQTMTTAFTTLYPVFQGYAQMTGDLQPMNNLVSDYTKGLDLDPNRYQMKAAPMVAQPGTQPPADDSGHQSPASTNIPAPG